MKQSLSDYLESQGLTQYAQDAAALERLRDAYDACRKKFVRADELEAELDEALQPEQHTLWRNQRN